MKGIKCDIRHEGHFQSWKMVFLCQQKNTVIVTTEPAQKENISIRKKKRSITINTVLEEKLREAQSMLIRESKTSWSLSRTVNVLVIIGLLGLRNLSKEDLRKIKYFIENDKILLDNKKTMNHIGRIVKGQ